MILWWMCKTGDTRGEARDVLWAVGRATRFPLTSFCVEEAGVKCTTSEGALADNVGRRQPTTARSSGSPSGRCGGAPRTRGGESRVTGAGAPAHQSQLLLQGRNERLPGWTLSM